MRMGTFRSRLIKRKTVQSGIARRIMPPKKVVVSTKPCPKLYMGRKCIYQEGHSGSCSATFPQQPVSKPRQNIFVPQPKKS
jgi:hypothetical protein